MTPSSVCCVNHRTASYKANSYAQRSRHYPDIGGLVKQYWLPHGNQTFDKEGYFMGQFSFMGYPCPQCSTCQYYKYWNNSSIPHQCTNQTTRSNAYELYGKTECEHSYGTTKSCQAYVFKRIISQAARRKRNRIIGLITFIIIIVIIAILILPNTAYEYNSRGIRHGRAGNYNRAIRDFNRAIRMNPNLAEAYSNRGNAYTGINNYDSAIADHTEAIRINPNLASAYFNRGNAHYLQGDLDRAAADWEETLRIDPNHSTARTNLESLR